MFVLVRMLVRVGMRVIMRMVVLMGVVVLMVMMVVVAGGAGGADALQQQGGADPDDRNSGNRAQHRHNLFRQHVARQEQRSQPEEEHRDGVGESDHASQENRVSRSSAR